MIPNMGQAAEVPIEAFMNRGFKPRPDRQDRHLDDGAIELLLYSLRADSKTHIIISIL